MEPLLPLHLDDETWAREFAWRADQLEDNEEGQSALWPVDDLLGQKRYVPCPQRGQHTRLVECWMCWCDVAYGYAGAIDVLHPDALF